jgi:hypothetical protein
MSSNSPDFKKIHKRALKLKFREATITFLYILPDIENEFEQVFEIVAPSRYKTREKWMNIMANAAAEYYKNSDIYDEDDHGITTTELVLSAIVKHKIPLVKYWESVKTEKINIFWLCKQVK